MELNEEILKVRRMANHVRTCENIHKQDLIAKLLVLADDLEQKNQVLVTA